MSPNFDFSVQKFGTRSVFEEPQLTQMSLNSKTSCSNFKIRELLAKLCVAFLLFQFWKNYDVLKWKSPCILLNKNIDLNKNETESKMQNSTYSFRETNLNCELKVKLWWVGIRERKKRAFFVPFIFSEGIFFNICILSQCTECPKKTIVYWIHFQNMHTSYQKHYFIHFFACF